MSRVDGTALAAGLERLREGGIIRSWQARPLGMFWLTLPNGEDLRPSTKETAMWAMGALHSAEVTSMALVTAQQIDRVALEGDLNDLREGGYLRSWSLDSDGDYEVQLPDTSRGIWYAKDMTGWLYGMHVALKNFGSRNAEEVRSLQAQLAAVNEKADLLDRLVDQLRDEQVEAYQEFTAVFERVQDELENVQGELEDAKAELKDAFQEQPSSIPEEEY